MKSKHADVELNEYNKIDRIDPTHSYYLGKPKKCGVRFTEKNIKSIQKCRYTKKNKNFESTISDYSLLIMPNGGTDLKTWSEKMRQMTSTLENRQTVRRFFFEAQRLFKGLIHFQKYGILHNDLKPANIVYNAKTGRANFIDFGLMADMREILGDSRDSKNSFAEYAFWSYPLDLMFYNRAIFNKYAKFTQKEKDAIYRQIVEDYNRGRSTKTTDALKVFFNYITKFVSEEVSTHMMNQYMEGFYQTLTKYVVPEKYDVFLEKSLKTFDVYGLGFSLMYCLNSCQHLMSSRVYNMLYDCFLDMYSGNLDIRLTPHKAFAQYVKILRFWKTLKDKSLTRLSLSSIKPTKSAEIEKIEANAERTLDLLREKI
jgi:serine/threonine protein kinase